VKLYCSNSLFRCCLQYLLALTLVPAYAQAADLHVGAGQTYATIADAQTAATNGDTIVVHNGTYDEAPTGGGGINGWSWNKDVNIVAAPGAKPTMICTPTAYSYCMFSITGGTSASLRVWDGIDLKVTKYNYSRGTIINVGFTGLATFKNMKIYDTGAENISAGSMFYIDSGINQFNLDNFTMDCEEVGHFGFGFVIDGGVSRIKIDNSNFIGQLNSAVLSRVGTGNRIEVSNTTFTQTRTPYFPSYFIRQATGSVSVSDSIFKVGGSVFSGGYETFSYGAAGVSGPTSTTLTRCLLDTRLGGHAINIASSEAGGSSFRISNSVFLDSSEQGTPGAIKTTEQTGATSIQIDHCTFNNTIPNSNLTAIVLNTECPNPINLILRNNLFSLPESTKGVVMPSNDNGLLYGNLSLSAGTNLRWNSGFAISPNEKLNGTIISGDPDLEPDLFHIGSNSAALQQGVDLGISVDFEGDSRPAPVATNPDLGADESDVIPEGPVASAKHWSFF
jgi:hypothetical protein